MANAVIKLQRCLEAVDFGVKLTCLYIFVIMKMGLTEGQLL